MKDTAEKGSVRDPVSLIAMVPSADPIQAELQQEIENLRRENNLITSAWYDMTSRLQSNTVILQRRSEAPKGWLGKQRAAVGGTSILVCLHFFSLSNDIPPIYPHILHEFILTSMTGSEVAPPRTIALHITFSPIRVVSCSSSPDWMM